MYLQDVGGDENFHLYLQPLDGKPAKDLTAFEGVRAQNLVTDKHFPGEVVLHTTVPAVHHNQICYSVLGWFMRPGGQVCLQKDTTRCAPGHVLLSAHCYDSVKNF